MTKKVILNSPTYSAIVSSLFILILISVGVAHAETNRQGFYGGIELGFANAENLSSVLSGVSHPTRCDQLLGGPDEGVVPISNSACQADTPQQLSENSFDLSTGLLAGFSVGYMQDNFRVELEYLNRSHSGDSSLWKQPGGNTAFQSKDSEWSEINPPSERIGDFNAHQLFVNAYYDFLNESRWTPYLGVGVGWARTSLDYGVNFTRKTSAQGYPTDRPPAAAGSVSFLDTESTDTLFGFQFIGGLDYALTEKLSIGVKGRRVNFQDMQHNAVWNLIRSHKPVRADGVTPFDSSLKLSDMEYWALNVGLKYSF